LSTVPILPGITILTMIIIIIIIIIILIIIIIIISRRIVIVIIIRIIKVQLYITFTYLPGSIIFQVQVS
jgi:hypothetical protein